MSMLEVNPDLQVSWNEGRTVLSIPGFPPKMLNDVSGIELLSQFASPREVSEVIAEYEDSLTAAEAVEEFYCNGALIHAGTDAPLPADLLREKGPFREIQERVASCTMGTPALNYALYKATEYVVAEKVPGDIVECGVWKGGSAMICALTLLYLKATERKIYLYDTFDASWPEPTGFNGTIYGRSYEDTLAMHRQNATRSRSAEELAREGLGLDAVRSNLMATGYPMTNLVFVKGLVEETVPGTMPERISLLRLDTDFYRSTYHELLHLYPRIEQGGVLLVDDYPTESGATKAVDQYFRDSGHRIFLSRIDVQGRIGVKQK